MFELAASIAVAVFLLFAFVIIPMMFRVVVPANEVHIVQQKDKTTPYGVGAGEKNGNVYYKWPEWVPVIGVTRSKLQVSIFDVDLEGYEAYDKGRVPFVVDVKAFFRVDDFAMAAQRAVNQDELHSQLKAIVQSAVRTILANSEIEEILEGRSQFGESFTKEVAGNLKQWGIATVKNIELMDIRDAKGSAVVANIMEKKKSLIEMESRTAVAVNKQKAQTAEIEADREINLRKQEATQQVGERQAQAARAVGIANEQAAQQVKTEAAITAQKEIAIRQVNEVGQAEINKNVAIVAANQNRETAIINAETQKQQAVVLAEGQKQKEIINAEATKESTVLRADGDLTAAKNNAEGTRALGLARAEAEKAMQMAPVDAQITLAKEIGENEGYQSYLIQIKQVEANKEIGVKQAEALTRADVKIIANTGDVQGGMKSVTELLTPKGGTNVAGMLSALAQTDEGKALLAKLGLKLGDIINPNA